MSALYFVMALNLDGDRSQKRHLTIHKVGLEFCLNSFMKLPRAIFAFFIAISVAMPPAVGAAALSLKSMDISVSMNMPASDYMSASQDMSDCCPPDAAPCDKATGNCPCIAACAFNFFSFSSGAFSDLVFPLIRAQILPSLARQTVRAQTSSPPFRPPRV